MFLIARSFVTVLTNLALLISTESPFPDESYHTTGLTCYGFKLKLALTLC